MLFFIGFVIALVEVQPYWVEAKLLGLALIGLHLLIGKLHASPKGIRI